MWVGQRVIQKPQTVTKYVHECLFYEGFVALNLGEDEDDCSFASGRQKVRGTAFTLTKVRSPRRRQPAKNTFA